MTKRVLSLLVLLTAVSFAGPLLTPDAVPFLETDTTSIDLSSVPMDDIDVIPQAVPLPDEVSVESVGRAIAAAPEPTAYGFAAIALLAAGSIRRRKAARSVGAKPREPSAQSRARLMDPHHSVVRN